MATAVQSRSESASNITPGSPIIVDLGKKSKKQIKQMRSGTGKLIDEVQGVIEELRTAGTVSADAQPIVFVVRQRRRRMNSLFPL
jgi:hypothetical protein